MSHKVHSLSIPAITDFLQHEIDAAITDVEPLQGGDWSQAYAYKLKGKEFVLRIGEFIEDFERDQIAASFRHADLPVPEFIALGEAFDLYYAITTRAHGKFLDDLTPSEATLTMPSLLAALNAMRLIPVSSMSDTAPSETWAQHLLSVEDEKPRTAGWKARLQTWPDLQEVWNNGLGVLHDLAANMPNEYHVVHSDLLNRNVLVDEVTWSISAVLDWGCSIYGDYLYDVAWLSYCAEPYTAGFDSERIKNHAFAYFKSVDADVEDFAMRVHCYELHIGLDSLAYNAFRNRPEVATVAATKVQDLLS